MPPAQVALAWLLHKPGVTSPIVGATKPAHLEDALAAAELTLSADEIARLEEPYRPHPVLGHGLRRRLAAHLSVPCRLRAACPTQAWAQPALPLELS